MKHYSWLFGQDASAGNKYPSKLYVKENELIALSDFLQDEFERNYSIRPTIVIPPGIEKQVQDENPRDIDMLAVGSLIPLKRFEIFVEIVATIRKQIPTINAMIVGDGPERNKLKNLVSTLGLEGNINFTGAVDHQQVLNLMQRAKVLLHPSSYEGFSGVCQEALNSGMHVVSFSRAMNYDIRQWHIVQTKTEMTQRAISILTNRFVEFVPVPFPSMIDTARQIMNCYL
jgi:glycosyltransferase involved in cell wall biosynthesis